MSQPMDSLTPHVYDKMIRTLACTRLCEFMQELNVFISGSRIFMVRREEKRFLKIYLRILYGAIVAHTAHGSPSTALTILLNIYSPMQVINEVRTLLQLYRSQEENILRTSHCLFEWIRVYNFCEDFSYWIMAFFQRLRQHQRNNAIDKISFAKIEKALMLFISPELRPQVALGIFHMLGNIQSMPQIFLKILPQVPVVVNHLRSNPTGVDKFGRDQFVFAKDLVFLMYTLMKRFLEFDYDSVNVVLELLESSMNFNNISYTTVQLEPQPQVQQILQHGRQVSRCGLVNMGNNCYLNSVLQVLAMTKEFSRDFLLLQTQSVMLREMQKLIALLHHSMREEVQPTAIISATHPADFVPGEQQDSSEFLGYLLNLLHDQEINEYYQHLEEQLVRNYDFSVDHSPSSPSPSSPMAGDFLISVTDRTFAGKVSTIYRCLNCGSRSRNDDGFHDLQLSFPEGTVDDSLYSVQSLLDMYCSPEILDGENQYQCCHCQCLRDGERCIQMIEAPRNLILTLKQFNFEKLQQIRTKLMHKVFHNERILVKLFSKDTLEEVSMVQYSLYAVVVHKGLTLDSGHYFTLACDHLDNWYKFDDSYVSISQSEEIHSLKSPNTPYILFYKMCAVSYDLISDDPTWHTETAHPRNAGPLTIEELPVELQNYIHQDNQLYEMEKLKKKEKRKYRDEE